MIRVAFNVSGGEIPVLRYFIPVVALLVDPAAVSRNWVLSANPLQPNDQLCDNPPLV
jgi:hypothetical protein